MQRMKFENSMIDILYTKDVKANTKYTEISFKYFSRFSFIYIKRCSAVPLIQTRIFQVNTIKYFSSVILSHFT